MASPAYRQFVRDVIEQTSIVELVTEAGGKLKPAGRHQMVCCSPLRNEKDPSFRVYVDQNSWWDFGSGEGSDVVDFVQLTQNVDFNGAIDILAERLGKKWGNGSGGKLDPETEEAITRVIERRWVEKISTEAASYYHSRLNLKGRKWLRDKYGFDDEIIDRARIGFADGSLLGYLRKERGYKLDDILKTGLFLRTQTGRIHEQHEQRITFPYLRGGSAAYMISRRVDGITPGDDWNRAKYKKSLTKSENHPYVSRHVRNDVLYGEDSVKRHVRVLIVTEGVTDAITAQMCGWPVISPVTTRFKKEDIERVLRLSEKADRVVILNDNEEPKKDKRTGRVSQPGFDGAADTSKVLFEAGKDVRVGILPRDEGIEKVDLNSLVKDNGPKALDPVIDAALTYPEFLISRVPPDVRPVELDEALSPAYAAMAACPAVEREAYANYVCSRFGLSAETVKIALDEFIKARGGTSTPLAPPIAPPSPPALPPGDDGAGDGGSGGNGFEEHDLLGAIHEHPDGYYFKWVKQEKEEFALSNFVLTPKKIVQLDGFQRMCCDIRLKSGRVFKDVLFRPRLFSSKREFRDQIQAVHALATWNGNDENVGGVQQLLTDKPILEYRGVPTIGYVEIDGKPRWVMPDYVLGPDGRDNDTNIIYAPHAAPSPIAPHVDLSGATLADSEIRPLAQRIVPQLFQLNTPEVILPLIGWFYASAVSPIIRSRLGHLPLLWIWGSQGSGKSTVACDLFWRLLGVKTDPLSCSGTQFPQLVAMSSTTSIPLIYDEFRNLTPRQKDSFTNRLRGIYRGSVDPRGRQDQFLINYQLQAPICVIGEQPPSDPALLERSLCVSPYKNSVDARAGRIIAQLTHEPLQLLGGHYVRFVLGRDIRNDLDTALALMQAKMLPKLSTRPAERICDTLLVAVLGDYLHQKWCDSLGVVVDNRPKMQDVFKILVENITETEDGGAVKDVFDQFFEALSIYAHQGVLREGIHYTSIAGRLYLHLPTCHQLYLMERRKTNQPDETNGIRALRRVLKEKHQAGSYVTDLSHRVCLGANSQDARQVRAVEIDTALIPGHLDVDTFPVSVDRRQGRTYDFGFN